MFYGCIMRGKVKLTVAYGSFNVRCKFEKVNMTQKAAFTFLALFMIFSFAERAQSQDPKGSPANKPPTATPANPCPAINVQAQPAGLIRDGQRVFFSMNLTGGDPNVAPVIVWNTSAGVVVQGQNTHRIEVDTTGAGANPDREIKADLWVGGYAPECQQQATALVKIIPPAVKFGEFGMVDDPTFKRNIETLSNYLSQSTTDSVYVMAYAGRASDRNFLTTWIRKIRDALVAGGLTVNRLRATDGGYREEPVFEFWIIPSGAEPPTPTPTLKRSDVIKPVQKPTKKP